MQLEILSSDKIDKQKWDECVKLSANSLIYATSVYLDHMADNWDGIIAEDYKFVMPAPWRKKFGIKYCYDVPFVQQLGLFGINLQEEHLSAFKRGLQKSYRYGDYSFNYVNPVHAAAARNNYILPLSSKYEVLKQFYSSNLAGNLSKLNNRDLQYQPGGTNEAIALFKNLYAKRFPHVTENDYKNFAALCQSKEQENNLIIRQVVAGDEILSAALFLKDDRRIYNLMPSTTEQGRQRSAGHYLFDCMIKEFSHSGMMLDFEGSDIPGIEKFYAGFGAVNQPYFKLHFNRLPVLLKVFKR
jgi:hypothetical protein